MILPFFVIHLSESHISILFPGMSSLLDLLSVFSPVYSRITQARLKVFGLSGFIAYSALQSLLVDGIVATSRTPVQPVVLDNVSHNPRRATRSTSICYSPSRTSPISTLRVESSIPLAVLHLEYIRTRLAVCLARQPADHPPRNSPTPTCATHHLRHIFYPSPEPVPPSESPPARFYRTPAKTREGQRNKYNKYSPATRMLVFAGLMSQDLFNGGWLTI